MFAHFALPYDLLGFSSPFFRSCSALAFRLLSKACSWFCGLAKVTATFLVWIWDPRTVNELDIVRGLASFFGFTYGASFERLKNTMVIFSPKCWVALPEAFFQQTWDTCAKKEVCQKKSVLPSKLSPLLFSLRRESCCNHSILCCHCITHRVKTHETEALWLSGRSIQHHAHTLY